MTKVFIVDDSEEIRERLSERLSTLAGLQVVGRAATEGEAIEGIARSRPDIVILDIRLREGNGIAVLERIKADGGGPRVIVFTHHPLPQYRARCLRLGAEALLHKARDGERIEEIVSRMIEEARSKR